MSCFYCPFYSFAFRAARAMDIATLNKYLGQDVYVFTSEKTYYGKLTKVHPNGDIVMKFPPGGTLYLGNELITGIAPLFGSGGFGQVGGGFGGGGFGF